MKTLNFKMVAMLAAIAGIVALTSCNKDDDKEPECAAPDLNNLFIVAGSQALEMTSTGGGNFEFSTLNFGENSLSFVFANNTGGTNATFGKDPASTITNLTGVAIQKVVDGTIICGDNSSFELTNLQGQNINITFNTNTLAYNISTEEFNPCTQFGREQFYIRWRNTTNAGDFLWAQMTPVAGQNGIFQISQPAANFYLPDADVPNFGAQIIEFSNQPDYGGLNNGELWPLYRNRQDNSSNGFGFWTFEKPAAGVTSKTALFITVSTRDEAGNQTVICPAPDDVDRAQGFRLLFAYDGESIFSKTNTLRYVIDTFSGEVAVFIE